MTELRTSGVVVEVLRDGPVGSPAARVSSVVVEILRPQFARVQAIWWRLNW